jgi:hypothetical protein
MRWRLEMMVPIKALINYRMLEEHAFADRWRLTQRSDSREALSPENRPTIFSRCLSIHACFSATVMGLKLLPVSGSILRVSIMVRQMLEAQQRAAVKDMSVMPRDSFGYSVMSGCRSASFTLRGGLESKLLSSMLDMD